jgi:Mediator of CRAC channel activity
VLWLCAAQISSLSALLSGFALIAITEIQIPIDVNGYLLVVFGTVTAAAVGCALSAMLSSTLVLVAVSDHMFCITYTCPAKQSS